jgi:hypothetical protein
MRGCTSEMNIRALQYFEWTFKVEGSGPEYRPDDPKGVMLRDMQNLVYMSRLHA